MNHVQLELMNALLQNTCLVFLFVVWHVLALVQRLLLERKVATQREAYYCLVQHFKSQAEFNAALQGLVMYNIFCNWSNFLPLVLVDILA